LYRLVIVEDEEHIRHSLQSLIPWKEMGFQVVEAFSDGLDALKYLKDNPCDVLLTDIMMNRMTGLDMIQNLYKIHPQLKIVILSGYSDFTYAQRAIQYKVVNYLVKPVDEEELMTTFRGIKELLDREREEALLADSETRELKHMLQTNFFRQLLSGQITSEDELTVYLKTLGIEKIQKVNPLFAFEISERCDQDESVQEEWNASLEDVLENLFLSEKDSLLFFVTEERHNVWCVAAIGLSQLENGDSGKQFNRQMQHFAEELGNALADRFVFHLTHYVSQISDLLTGTKIAPDLADALPKQEVDSALYSRVMSEYKLLIVELDTGSNDTLSHILDELFRKLRATPLEDIRFIFKSLYAVIDTHYKKRKIDTSAVTGGKFDAGRLYGYDKAEDFAACVKADFDALCNSLRAGTYESTHSTIQHVVTYLNEHISEEIGHEAIAAKYRIHPGYLSRLFKQEMGETLSEYQLRIKTERAAVLLKDGQYKVGQIAVMVGCNASSYFSIMFKKNTGYSPREYIQKVSL